MVGSGGAVSFGCVAVCDGVERGGGSESCQAARERGLVGEVSDDAWEWIVVPCDADWDRGGRRAGRAAGPPAPTWWAHHCAVAWMAAWVKLRGHGLLGARELLVDDEWSGEISWRDSSGFEEASHRPDLIVLARTGGRVAIEVELTKKSVERLRAILARHALWRTMRLTGGVIYVCADRDGCKRIAKHGADVGIAKGRGLRVELLDTIKAQALGACEEVRATRRSRRSAAPRPVLAVDGG